MQFKEEENENPYDSDEQEYRAAQEAEQEYEDDLDSDEEAKSYDSELEADFFGKKDPEANGRLEKEAKEAKAAEREARAEKEQIDSSKKFNPKDFDEKLEDVLKKAQRYRPAAGVEFVQYDRFGYKMGQKDDEEVRKYIANENDNNGFSFTAANDEQMSKALELQ